MRKSSLSLSRTRCRVKRFPHSTSPLIQMSRLARSWILKKPVTENQTPKRAKILAIRSSGSQIVQNAPRVHFQIESFGMERPGGVQRVAVVAAQHTDTDKRKGSRFFFL